MAYNLAITVGVNKYQRLGRSLKYAVNDAERMRDFLLSEGFDEVLLYSDHSPIDNLGYSTSPTRSNLRCLLNYTFNELLNPPPDNLWFFFSGHGVRSRNVDYLMTSDAVIGDIEETAISVNFVMEKLYNSGAANIVLILDACRDQGASSSEGIGEQTAQEASSKGIISFFSCKPDQFSFEIDDLEQGAFTYAFIEGLKEKKSSTVEELNHYLKKRVKKIAVTSGIQIPYTRVEPLEKQKLILLQKYSSETGDGIEKHPQQDATIYMKQLPKELLERYVNPEVANQLLAGGDIGLGGKPKQVTVLFSDVSNYTALTENLQAEAVVNLLNEYFQEMVDIILHYEGIVDKFIGGGLMVTFGSVVPLDDHSWMAMQAAIKMRYRLAELNEARIAEELIPISIRMGLNSDEVIIGNIGSSKRMNFTAIGDGVNLASRLEGSCKDYGVDIIISENTYQSYAERLIVRELDYALVKGKSKPIKIYELVGIKPEYLVNLMPEELDKYQISEQQQQILEHYHKGREYHLKPMKEKLVYEDFIRILEQLNSLSESQVQKLSYDEKTLLKQLIKKMSPAALTDILGSQAISRLDLVTLNKQMNSEEINSLLNKTIQDITPLEMKKLLIAKLKQFTVDDSTQEMLEEEAQELSTAQLKKLIELAKKLFARKAKEAFRQAKREFIKVLEIDPQNEAAKLHVKRCILFETDSPPDETWDGVWRLTEK